MNKQENNQQNHSAGQTQQYKYCMKDSRYDVEEY